MTKPALLVMAAGMGSRYGGLKQIDPVGPAGETIIDYSIYDAIRAGFGKLVFVIRKDIEQQFREIVGARFEKRIAVEYAFQEIARLPAGFSVPEGRTKPWGTTHAILMAENLIKEPFAVINADDFYGWHAYKVLADYLISGSPDYAMVGFILKNTLSEFGSVSRGVSWADKDHYLTSIAEMKKVEKVGTAARNTDAAGKITNLTGEELVSMNFWGFTPALFPQIRESFEAFLRKSAQDLNSECYIPITMGELVSAQKAKVKVLSSPDSWFGVTYKEDRPHVIESIRKLIAKGDYPQKLWA
jgi:UTP-glucose-1-phosphate uridylyltransferase